jgi:hypothetical protein
VAKKIFFIIAISEETEPAAAILVEQLTYFHPRDGVWILMAAN